MVESFWELCTLDFHVKLSIASSSLLSSTYPYRAFSSPVLTTVPIYFLFVHNYRKRKVKTAMLLVLGLMFPSIEYSLLKKTSS